MLIAECHGLRKSHHGSTGPGQLETKPRPGQLETKRLNQPALTPRGGVLQAVLSPNRLGAARLYSLIYADAYEQAVGAIVQVA